MTRRTFLLVYAGLALLFVGPLWIVVHPPAMDLPANAALGTILASRGTDGDPYATYFSISSLLNANTFYYFFIGIFGRILPVHFVSKLLLSVAILATPAAVAYARDSAEQDIELGLVGFAFALTFNTIAGFIGFALGLPLMLVLAGLARRQMADPTPRRAAAIAAVSTLTFFVHAQVFLFSLGVIGLCALCSITREPGWYKRFGATVGPAGVAVAVAAPWYIRSLGVMSEAGGASPHFQPAKVMIDYLPIHTFDQLRSSWDSYLGFAIVIGLAVIAVLGFVPWRGREISGSWFRRYAYYLCALAAVILYFVLPSSVRYQQVINGRQAMVALLLLCAAVHFRWDRLAMRLALFAVLALVVAYGAVYAHATIKMGAESRDLEAILKLAPKGSRLVAPHMPRSRFWRMDVYRHVGSYHVVWNRGYVANTFGATLPIQAIQVSPKLFRPPFNVNNVERFYDVVLSGKQIDSPKLQLVAAGGPFYLYVVVRP